MARFNGPSSSASAHAAAMRAAKAAKNATGCSVLFFVCAGFGLMGTVASYLA